MDIENIHEAEELIKKVMIIKGARDGLDEIYENKHQGVCRFSIIDVETEIKVNLYGLKSEVLNSIHSALNDECDKLSSRLRDL